MFMILLLYDVENRRRQNNDQIDQKPRKLFSNRLPEDILR